MQSQLYTPGVLPEFTTGVTPPYNVFPFSGVNRDLSGLLGDENSNFANNIQNAASGHITGLVYNGDPSTLVSEALFFGRQIEAARHAQQHNSHKEEHESHALKVEKLHSSDDVELPAKLGLSTETVDAVKGLGKSLGSFMYKDCMRDAPTASLGNFGPSAVPFLGVANNSMALAA